jgi:hypothetical protein
MNSLKWGMYLPKWTDGTLYFKDIVTFCVEDDKIIGAKRWDIYGNSKVIPYIDFVYDKDMAEEAEVSDIDTSLLIGPVVRKVFLFDTEKEAYAQKIWCLKKIREYFYYHREEERRNFDSSIPVEINNSMDKIISSNPEYFL